MSNNCKNDYPFPENLVSAIFGGYEGEILNPDQLKGLKYAVSTLSEREQKVLANRFRDGYTLEEVGKQLQLSRERIRQIETLALRKLRHPSRIKYIKEGYSIVSGEFEKALNEKYAAIEDDRKRRLKEITDTVCKLERRMQLIKTLCEGNFDLIMSEVYNIRSEIPGSRYNENIHEMYNRGRMPVRIYNCLRRHFEKKLNFNSDALEKLTLLDVAQLTRSDVMSIRNLGNKSFITLEKIMYEHGLQFKPEEY